MKKRDGSEQEQNSGGDTVFVRSPCPLIVLRDGFTASPSYSQLVSVWDNDKGRNPSVVVAWFVHELIILRGRDLGRHAEGLRQRKAWEIEEVDKALLSLAAKGEPVVTSIEFVYEDIPGALAELRGLRRKPERKAAKKRAA